MDEESMNRYHAEEHEQVEAYSLLEWVNDNLLKAECVAYAIADTGDHGSLWHVEDYDGRMSYGQTFIEAIQDAMKSDNDPTRYDLSLIHISEPTRPY